MKIRVGRLDIAAVCKFNVSVALCIGPRRRQVLSCVGLSRKSERRSSLMGLCL